MSNRCDPQASGADGEGSHKSRMDKSQMLRYFGRGEDRKVMADTPVAAVAAWPHVSILHQNAAAVAVIVAAAAAAAAVVVVAAAAAVAAASAAIP